VVEDSRAGWVPHWEEIAAEHRRGSQSVDSVADRHITRAETTTMSRAEGGDAQ
jgi:hypothetical protein